MALTSTKGKVPTGYADEIVISESSFRSARLQNERATAPSKKRKREARGDSSVVYGENAYKGPWAKYNATPDPSSGSEEEVEEYEEVIEDAEQSKPPPPSKAGTAYEETGNGAETTEFNGSEQYDYQGRTYMHVPQDLDIDLLHDNPNLKNFHPKKLIHIWKGHTKPITQTRFFPNSGHLLLSAAADSKVKIWDVYHQRELLRTYSGHSKSVTDIDFQPGGSHFLSASYDRQIKLWDTETGACISRFSTGKTPHVIRFNPSSPHEFLAGMNDKKIVQFDTRESSDGKPTQEYDHHLGPVNTITFCDENRRFITTSDDKSLRAWEYNIPVPIKFIAEPYMYPMVRSAPHPSGKYVAFQSSDNQIVVYSSTDRFRQNRKKSYRGHNNAGFAIDVAISPDGGLIASGDSAGWLVFWDWKTCRMFHKIQAGDTACVSVVWHPKETSKVVTGSLDGNLRYYD